MPEKHPYRELKTEYRRLELQYIRAKNAIKDEARAAREDLKTQYKIDRLRVKKPLAAERYRLRAEAKKRHRLQNEPPRRGVLPEIGNAVTHGVGALIAALFLVLMILRADTARAVFAGVIYGSCFLLQMLFSCLYHALRGGIGAKRVFRRFDYCSIYLQIGGTFTPLYLLYIPAKMWGLTAGLIFFGTLWLLVATGITMVSVFGPGRIKWLHFSLYFILGWSALMFVPTWIASDLPLFLFILSGGLLYTLGMIPFAALRGKDTAHFIWHFFVLAGAILQWIGIYLYVFPL